MGDGQCALWIELEVALVRMPVDFLERAENRHRGSVSSEIRELPSGHVCTDRGSKDDQGIYCSLRNRRTSNRCSRSQTFEQSDEIHTIVVADEHRAHLGSISSSPRHLFDTKPCVHFSAYKKVGSDGIRHDTEFNKVLPRSLTDNSERESRAEVA